MENVWLISSDIRTCSQSTEKSVDGPVMRLMMWLILLCIASCCIQVPSLCHLNCVLFKIGEASMYSAVVVTWCLLAKGWQIQTDFECWTCCVCHSSVNIWTSYCDTNQQKH